MKQWYLVSYVSAVDGQLVLFKEFMNPGEVKILGRYLNRVTHRIELEKKVCNAPDEIRSALYL